MARQILCSKGLSAALVVFFHILSSSDSFLVGTGYSRNNLTEFFECGPMYQKKKEEQPFCFPKTCGRMILDNFASEEEVEVLRNMAEKSFLGIPCISDDFLDAANLVEVKSDDGKSRLLVNYPGVLGLELSDIMTEEEVQVYIKIRDRVSNLVRSTFGVKEVHLDIPPQFMRYTKALDIEESRLLGPAHVDIVAYPAMWYTTLLYLSDSDVEFGGAEFVIYDEDRGMNISVSSRKGRLAMFTSGDENFHQVQALRWGTRYVILFGWECTPGMTSYWPVCENPLTREPFLLPDIGLWS